MAKKKELIVNKMYVWDLEVEGQDLEWKCFVGIDEVITYENGVECQRMKIENMRQAQGVIQIDTEVKVGDENVPFQLENGIPYIKLMDDEAGERKWKMSETTLEDRLDAQCRSVKKEAYSMGAVGLVMMAITLVDYLMDFQIEDMNFCPLMSAIFLAAGGMNLVRLRNELMQLGRKFTWKL